MQKIVSNNNQRLKKTVSFVKGVGGGGVWEVKNTKCLVLNQVFPLNSENTTRFCSTPIENLEVGGGGGIWTLPSWGLGT